MSKSCSDHPISHEFFAGYGLVVGKASQPSDSNNLIVRLVARRGRVLDMNRGEVSKEHQEGATNRRPKITVSYKNGSACFPLNFVKKCGDIAPLPSTDYVPFH